MGLLFVLGNGIITLPQQNATKYTFFAFLVSFAIGVALVFAGFIKGKIILYIASFLSVFIIGDTAVDFLKFISSSLLLNVERILIILPFLAVITLFGLASKKAVLKFSLISGILSLLAVVFFFFFTLKDFEIKNIIIKSLPDYKNLYFQTIPYIKKVALPGFLIGVFARDNGFSKKTAVFGTVLGNLTLAFCILNSLLLFGNEFAGRLDYPYALAISTVTFGNLFCRLDGFAYFIYFASCLVKITLSVSVIKSVMSNCKNNMCN